MCICMLKGHLHTLKILESMSEFDGLWKHENNPANTKSVSLQNVEVGHYIEETLQINKAACSSVLRII